MNCQRCSEESPDLRKLYMACLYDMSELGLPFTQSAFKATQIEGEVEQHPLGLDEMMKQERTLRFFNLLVCKQCRADWMRAISDWFGRPHVGIEDHAIKGGTVYVRDLGGTREATQEEVEQMKERL